MSGFPLQVSRCGGRGGGGGGWEETKGADYRGIYTYVALHCSTLLFICPCCCVVAVSIGADTHIHVPHVGCGCGGRGWRYIQQRLEHWGGVTVPSSAASSHPQSHDGVALVEVGGKV
eukprot:COSAG01_NODE_7065_length_3369_cov_10.052905_5_plen_117_part_00